MKSCKGVVLCAILTAFILTSWSLAAPPLKLQTAPPAIKKDIVKNIQEANPGLAVIGMQMRNSQELSLLDYEIKIKNESSVPYSGNAKLEISTKLVNPASPSNYSWDVGELGKTIGPLAAGGETSISGQITRRGQAVAIKAAIKTKSKEWMSKTAPLPEMPRPEVKIEDVRISDGKIYVTVKNYSNYKIDTKGGLGVRAQAGTIQTDNTVDFVPSGGFMIELEPQGQFTQSWTLQPGYEVYRASVYYSRVTAFEMDHKLIRP